MKMKRKLVVLIAIAMLVLSQLACGNFSSDSRTLDGIQRLVNQRNGD